jgi:hypothetical protein
MTITAVDLADLPAAVTDAFAASPSVVALELSARFDLPVSLTEMRDGWLVVALSGSVSSLDLADVLDRLDSALPAACDILVGDIVAALAGTPLGEFLDRPGTVTGLMSIYDPAAWFVRSVTDPDTDAVAAADTDAVALVALAEAMLTRIDALGLDTFLREEAGLVGGGPVPLRDRFRDSREDRQLLRRGLRGARRRHREVGEEGHRRAFRLGRSRRLTWTEMLLGLHIQAVADILHERSAAYAAPKLVLDGDVEGDDPLRYVVARRLPPAEPLMEIGVAIVNVTAPAGPLSVRYRRWGEERAVDVDAGVDLSLAGGALVLPLQVVDAAGERPSLSTWAYVPTWESGPGTPTFLLSGVQHGDVLVLEEPTSGARAEVAVVKNFSLADLERLHGAGWDLSVAAPFAGASGLAGALLETVAFILADGDATAQEQQRQNLEASLAGTYPAGAGTPPRAYPGTLDVPSARGVGILPDDASHLHLALPQMAPRPDIVSLQGTFETNAAAAAQGSSFPSADRRAHNPAYRSAVEAHDGAMRPELTTLLAAFEPATGTTTIWHTYELGQATTPVYLGSTDALRLWPGDPVRNVRTDYGGDPMLFAVGDREHALAGFDEQGLTGMLQLGVFIDRRAEVTLYIVPGSGDIVDDYADALQVADALEALTGPSLPPSAVLGGGAPPGSGGGGGATDSGDAPTAPVGSLLLNVLDDEAEPVGGVRVEVLDADGTTVHEGDTRDDGSLPVENLPVGDYTLALTHESHEPATTDVAVVEAATATVGVILSRAFVRCKVRCLKIKSKDLSRAYTLLHSCRVYLFEDDADLTYTHLFPEVKDDGEIDFDFPKAKPYAMYFAGRLLEPTEIERLRGERSHLLIRTSVTGYYLDIDSSFFWWIALLQYVEDHIVVSDPSDRPTEVLTCARRLYYDDGNWPYLIDRSEVDGLVAYDPVTGWATIRDDMELAPIMALGRTYELDGPNNFALSPGIGATGPELTRTMTDRHEYVILPDGEEVHIGHALAGLEAFLFPPSYVGSWVFSYPRSAATWAGDLGQAAYEAFAYLWQDAYFLAGLTERQRDVYDRMADEKPDFVAGDWASAQSDYARLIEMVGDVHGIALGQELVTGEPGAASLPAGRPLSELLEDHFVRVARGSQAVQLFAAEYAGYGLTYQVVKDGGVSAVQGLRDEVSSFAEVWDDTLDIYAANWNGSGPTDDQLLTYTQQYHNDVLNGMDW